MKYETKTKEQIHYEELLLDAIFQATFEICKLNKGDMEYHFNDRQTDIVERIQFKMEMVQ